MCVRATRGMQLTDFLVRPIRKFEVASICYILSNKVQYCVTWCCFSNRPRYDDDDVCGARHNKSEDMHIQTESCSHPLTAE